MSEPMAVQAEVKDWKELQGIEQPKFQEMLGAGKLDKFLNDQGFSEAIRSESIFKKAEPKPETVVAPPIPDPAPVPEATPPAAPVQDGDKWWAKRGFASEEEAVNSIDNLRQINDKKQEQIDRFNAERGTIGKEKQANQERINKLEAELKRERDERARVQGAAHVGDIPVAPIVPIPEDGLFDTPDYKEKMSQYRKDMQAYNEKMSKRELDRQTRISKLETDLAEAKNKTTDISASLQEGEQERRTKIALEQWQSVLGEVTKLQDHDVSLKTSKPFSEINDYVRTRGYEEAAKIYPKKDIENFDRICDVIKAYRNVDDHGTVDFVSAPRYKSLKLALYDMLETRGELDKFLTGVRTQGEKTGREQVIKAINEQGNRATVLPPGGQAADIVSEITDSDLDAKLREYAKPEYDTRTKTDPLFQKEVYDLMVRKAEKDPSWRSMIPTAWITKFAPK